MCPSSIRFECVDGMMAAVLRGKTPAERLRMADGMWRFARETIIAVLRQEHPEWDERRIVEEAVRRLSHGAV